MAFAIPVLCLALEGEAILFSPKVQHLDHIWENEVTNIVVIVSNSTPRVVNILAVDADCACTVPSTPEKRLSPGATTPMSIQFAPKLLSGPVTRSVTILTDAGTYAWQLNANVLSRIKVSPNSLSFQLREDQSFKTNVSVTFLGDENWFPDAIRLLPGMECSVRKGSDKDFRLELSLRPEAMEDFDWEGQFIYISGGHSSAATTLSVSGTRQRSLVLVPPSLNFGLISKKKTATASLIITHKNLKANFQILNVRAKSSRITCEATLISPGTYRMDATLREPALLAEGLFEEFVEVTTNDSRNKPYILRAFGVTPAK